MGQGRWPPSPQSRNRRSIRLRSYDYTWPGAYFFTICTQGQEGFLDETLVRDMIESVWHDLPNRFSDVRLDAFVVMPDHVHGIIIIEDPRKGETQDSRRGEPCVRPEGRAGGAPGEDERPFPSGNLAPDDAGRADTRSAPTTKFVSAFDKPASLGRVIQAFKSLTTLAYVRGVKSDGWRSFASRLWQRNYYEHVIRAESELNCVREYIANNPIRISLIDEVLPWEERFPDARD